MADGTLTARLTNGSSVTITIPTSSVPDARSYVQQITKGGGIWGDDGQFYPSTAIISVAIS